MNPWVKGFIINSNKATEEQQNIKLEIMTENLVCNDHLIRQRFHKLALLLLWSDCTRDMMSRIACRLLRVVCG
jgi:hypothetical protein